MGLPVAAMLAPDANRAEKLGLALPLGIGVGALLLLFSTWMPPVSAPVAGGALLGIAALSGLAVHSRSRALVPRYPMSWTVAGPVALLVGVSAFFAVWFPTMAADETLYDAQAWLLSQTMDLDPASGLRAITAQRPLLTSLVQALI